jgi:hypothetical protein
MSRLIKAESTKMELERAFRYAVTAAWDDLTRAKKPRSIHVEYLCEPGAIINHVSVWSLGSGGYQDLLCDYWTTSSPAHPMGISFVNNCYSEKLAQIFDVVMKNQGQFTRAADACRHGLVQIGPPTKEERLGAIAWTEAILSRALHTEEEASLRMLDEGCPNEGAALLLHEKEASSRMAA